MKKQQQKTSRNSCSSNSPTWIMERAKDETGEIGVGVPLTEPDMAAIPDSRPLTGYARWSLELKTLARERGLEWLLADDEVWMLETYNDGDTAKDALDHLISEATRSA